MTHTKDEIDGAIEVLLTGDYGSGAVIRREDLSSTALIAVFAFLHGQGTTEDSYLEAAGLLLGGWLPGEPLEYL